MTTHLEDDPRWRRLTSRDWVCPCCGYQHAGLFELAAGKPDIWPGKPTDALPNSAILDSGHVLTEDFCVIEEQHHFVRGTLRLPVLGSNDVQFGFGVWSSLSKDNFALYVENFDSDHQAELGPWFGWFANVLLGYSDTLNLKCSVKPRAGRLRPSLEIIQDHPLAHQQRHGINLDQILDIYAANGHDMRSALADA